MPGSTRSTAAIAKRPLNSVEAFVRPVRHLVVIFDWSLRLHCDAYGVPAELVFCIGRRPPQALPGAGHPENERIVMDAVNDFHASEHRIVAAPRPRALLLTPAAQSQIQFQDVSATTGMRFHGKRGRPGISTATTGPIFSCRDIATIRAPIATPARARSRTSPTRWTRASVAKPAFQDKHGASHADFDNDGDEDLLIGQQHRPAELLVNDNGVHQLRGRAGIDSDSTNRQGVCSLHGRRFDRQLHSTVVPASPESGQWARFDLDTGAGFSCNGDNNYGRRSTSTTMASSNSSAPRKACPERVRCLDVRSRT